MTLNAIEHFTSLDYTILGVVVFSIILSFFRGFLREAISLVTWVLAVILSVKFAPEVSKMLGGVVASQDVRYGISLGIVFIIVFIVGLIVNKIVGGLVNTTGLGFLDRILGLGFGAARGLVLAVAIILVIGLTPYDNTKWVQHSVLLPYLKPLVQHLQENLPENIGKVSSWLSNNVPNLAGNTMQHLTKK